MTNNTIINFNKVVSTSPILSEYLKKVEQLTQVNRLVLKVLDPALARHCRVVGLKDGILSLSTESPIWGHTLRFAELDILTKLRQYPEYSGLKSIRTLVRPNEDYSLTLGEYDNNNDKGPRLSSAGAACLKGLAYEVSSSRLKEALLKLASREL